MAEGGCIANENKADMVIKHFSIIMICMTDKFLHDIYYHYLHDISYLVEGNCN